MTRIRGVDFGPVWGASGVQKFFGDSWPHHERFKRWFPKGFDMTGMTFVAKTMTTKALKGNMPSDDQDNPYEARPRCVVVNPLSFLRGVALNAVGLTNRGARALFADGRWHERTEPFFISFAPQGKTLSAKIEDAREFIRICQFCLPFHVPAGLQLNLSCPNTGENVSDSGPLVNEALALLDEFKVLSVHLRIVVKINVLMPAEAARRISLHIACDGLCISNTIPWEALPSLGINRFLLFGTTTSPLRKRGFEQSGGLSGKPLLPLVERWVRHARSVGVLKHINAGGGILSPSDVYRLKDAGADSVSLGVITMLRPWRVQETIRAAHQVFDGSCWCPGPH